MKFLSFAVGVFSFVFCISDNVSSKNFANAVASDWPAIVQDADLYFSESPVAIEGARVGDGGEPGTFFLFSRLLIANGAAGDFLKLLQHSNPALRALAVVGLVRSPDLKAADLAKNLESVLNERTPVRVTDSGCVSAVSTLGQWAKTFLSRPDSLGHDADGPFTDSAYFLGRAFSFKAGERLDRGELEAARALVEAGLRRLGDDYASPQTIDDTELKLLAAQDLIKNGKTQDGVSLKLKMLKVRLDLRLKKNAQSP